MNYTRCRECFEAYRPGKEGMNGFCSGCYKKQRAKQLVKRSVPDYMAEANSRHARVKKLLLSSDLRGLGDMYLIFQSILRQSKYRRLSRRQCDLVFKILDKK